MQIVVCKSKIHRAKVTDANLNYEGSITIDEKLMQEADILPFEKVQVVNLNNGARFDTYVLVGKADSGTICLNGPTARLGQIQDLLIIISYCILKKEKAVGFKPKIVFVNSENKIVKIS
jgi:aspartate 1-decarboxylase